MRATELIGKKVIRTAPTSHGDYSYTSNPIIIINATDEHIIYKYPSNNCFNYFENKERVLNFTWCDDKWIDYKKLVGKRKAKEHLSENDIKILNDINALEFREELLQLLKKHDCSISTYTDNDMKISFNKYEFNSTYSIGNRYSEYDITREEPDKYGNILDKKVIDEYILYHFPETDTSTEYLKNSPITIGIFTNDAIKANTKFKEIYKFIKPFDIENICNSEYRKIIQLYNGDTYVWIRPREEIRGYRCEKAFIDRGLTLKELNNFVFPACVCCVKNMVKIF